MGDSVRQATNPIPKRLKTAREHAGLSQKALGIAAGVDEFVASARMNQYERGVHSPDYTMAKRLARVLRVPTAYLYADDDADAQMLLVFNALSKSARRKLLRSFNR